MSKKKNKIAHLSEQDYQNYISSLKDEKPTNAIVGNKKVPVGKGDGSCAVNNIWNRVTLYQRKILLIVNLNEIIRRFSIQICIETAAAIWDINFAVGIAGGAAVIRFSGFFFKHGCVDQSAVGTGLDKMLIENPVQLIFAVKCHSL